MRHPLFQSAAFLRAQVQLPDGLSVSARTCGHRVAFLTGATGFIGGYLLAELLRQNAFDKYYCLVRGADGATRLQRSLAEKGLAFEAVAAQLEVVPGDISQPRLGLSARDHARLSASVDHVFHFAGTMNWVAGFGAETRMNISALQAILHFATTRQTKYVNYASSMGAWSLLRQKQTEIPEDALHERPDLLPGGYCQAKWINEKICRAAVARGIPICIYRIGDVKGHSQTGRSDPSNFGNLLLRHIFQHQIAPAGTTRFNFLPVDYLVQAIAAISQNAAQHQGKTFQFSNPELLSMDAILAHFEAWGRPIQRLAPQAWYAALPTDSLEGRGLRAVFKPFIPETGAETTSFYDIGTALYQCEHASTQTALALQGTGIHCPRMLADGVLHRYLQAWTESGFPARQQGSIW